MTDLLPCPFCGNQDIILRHAPLGEPPFIHCNKCSLTKIGLTLNLLLQWWNTRADISDKHSEDDSPKARRIKRKLEDQRRTQKSS